MTWTSSCGSGSLRRTACAVALVGAVVTLVACGGGTVDVTEHSGNAEYAPVALAAAPALDGVLAASDALGLAMLGSASTPNAVVSPVSATVALSMLAEGARGATATAFDRALGAAAQERSDTVGALRAALLAHDGDPAVAAGDTLPDAPVLHLATRALLDDELVPQESYLDALSRSYDASLETLDLADPATKQTLDSWVERETGGLIEKSAITPTRDLRLVLQDAVVFAARWLEPFDPGSTFEDDFATSAGQQRVPTMHGSSSWAWTVRDVEGWRSVRMPYTDAAYADLILPPEGTDPAEVPVEVLTALRTGDGATQVVTEGDGTLVIVSVPVLDLAPDVLDLHEALDAVGLGELYDVPDLSGITTTEPLFVSQAFQQARLRLDEEGTVAAAVTEIGAEAGSAQLPGEEVEVRLDRPFLLRIAHVRTGATLFLAAVRDPVTP